MADIGVVGLGNMGLGMALSLRRGGHEVTGYDASPPARARAAAEEIQVAADMAAVCQRSTVIILSLPTAAIVEEVVAGEGGIAASAAPGALVIDTSTSEPATTRRLAGLLAARGIGLIDAPVSGGPAGARAGTLTMVIGGAAADVARATPVLESMSAKRVHIGPAGAGHVTKIINNLLCAAHLLTAAEAVRLARAAEVDPVRVLEGVNAGSGRSGVTLDNYPRWIFSDTFDSGFTMKLMRKDVRLAADMMQALDLALPLAAETARLWAASAETIGDDEDFNRIAAAPRGELAGV